MAEIITRDEAKQKGLKKYFSGRKCKRGHLSERYVSGSICISCKILKEDTDEHKEHRKIYDRRYYISNSNPINQVKKERYYANKEAANIRNAKWKKDNKDKVNAYCAKRRAAKIQRTPPWLTDDDAFLISEVYEQAQALTRVTGIDHHVDHIVPLQAELASGLHTPVNLQIIIASVNMSKNNTYDPWRDS